MMSITSGTGSLGAAPVQGNPGRATVGGEGTEGFAALLAGVMVPPPVPPAAPPAAPALRTGLVLDTGLPSTGGAGEGTASAGRTSGPGTGEGDDLDGAPVDPRALLLRAGIRTGDPARTSSRHGFGTGAGAVATSGAAGDAAGAQASGEAHSPEGPEAPEGKVAPDGKVATPDVLRATGLVREDTRPVPAGPQSSPTAEPPATGGGAFQSSDSGFVGGGSDRAAFVRSELVRLTGMAPGLGTLDGVVSPGVDLEGMASSGSLPPRVAAALAAAGLTPTGPASPDPTPLHGMESTASTLPVTAADRDLGRLNSDFRVKLERVVERLQREHGIEARFLEGFRPQLRQEHLFAQGRTAPGPVVTWTQNSMHTQGRAADLKLEGGEQSYRIMHQVAAEEGLRTLGMKDPGHLELPRAPGEPAFRTAAASTASPMGGVGLPGQVAAAGVPGRAMGGVAQVARVARVAAPARPGAMGSAGATGLPLPAMVEGMARQHGKGEAGDEVVTALGEGADAPGGSRVSAPLPETGLAPIRAAVTPGAGMAAVERVAALEELRESAPAGPMRRIDLRDADGQGTRVRIEMKGDVVRTEIRTPDVELARRLEPAVRDLEGALERQGLELGRLKVSRAPDVAAPREVMHPNAAEGTRGPTGEEESSSRSGQQRTPRDGDGADGQPRHRPRPGNPDREDQP